MVMRRMDGKREAQPLKIADKSAPAIGRRERLIALILSLHRTISRVALMLSRLRRDLRACRELRRNGSLPRLYRQSPPLPSKAAGGVRSQSDRGSNAAISLEQAKARLRSVVPYSHFYHTKQLIAFGRAHC